MPAAHPDRWWGRLPRTRAPLPPYPQDRPVPLSATTVGSLAACPLRWFLRHEVGVSGPAGAALQVGRLLHLLADDLARGRRAPDPEALARVVARALPVTDAHPPWCTMGLREQAADALARFLVHVAATGRELVGSEVSFDVVVELPSGPVRLRGALDRVEATREGGCVVVDLKTGSGSLPSAAATDEDVQLGLYQLLLARHQLPGVQGEPAGAELWYLRSPAGAGPAVRTQAPLDADRAARVAGRLDAAASLLRAEEFPATPGEHCRGCEVRTACPAVPDGRPVVP